MQTDEAFASLCKRFGISRKTGYKWLDRFELGATRRSRTEHLLRKRLLEKLSNELVASILENSKTAPELGAAKRFASCSGGFLVIACRPRARSALCSADMA
jgi:hypothetical protein